MTSLRPNPDRPFSLTRAKVAVLLAVLVLFFGVALFSPLHKHTLGKSSSCSFNHLEHQWISLAEAAVVLVPFALLLEAAERLAPADPEFFATATVRDRAPPALS